MKLLKEIIRCAFRTRKDPPKNYDAMVDMAIVKMDDGQFADSKALLEEVLSKAPDHYLANYELGYLLIQCRQYKAALPLLLRIENSSEVTDRYYQILGSLYDLMGDPGKGIDTFMKGLQRFPDSGRLHVELGMMYQKENQVMKALETYEKGILAEPMFPSNYFYAGLILLGSSEPVWGLMYGETFINLEPDTQRSEVMRKEMYGALYSNISVEDSELKVSLTHQSIGFDHASMSMVASYPVVYDLCMKMAGKEIEMDETGSISISMLARLRDRQLHHGKRYFRPDRQDPLYHYLLKVRDAGFLEDYCMFIFRGGAPFEYNEWFDANRDRYLGFLRWKESNDLQLDRNNCFSRLTCPPVSL